MANSIKTENFAVVFNGSVIAYNNKPMIFEVEGFSFIFEFKDDNSNKAQILVENHPDGKPGMVIKYFNYSNALGVENNSPALLGKSGNKNLFFNYKIYTIKPESSKLFYYTFYLEN